MAGTNGSIVGITSSADPKSDLPAASTSSPCSNQTCKQEILHHIKRPLNCFMIFSKKQREVISKEQPGLNHRDISAIIGQKWKLMTKEEKEPYLRMAEEAKVAHGLQFPGYKYQPKRRKKIAHVRTEPPLPPDLQNIAIQPMGEEDLCQVVEHIVRTENFDTIV